jgi:curved DNA-binding protein CbpA
MTEPKNSAPAVKGGESALPDDVVKRLEFLHERLATIDHYALLGLPRRATRSDVRAAFLALAPQFHPDRYFGRSLGPHAAKMQRVFAQLSAAHDVLANDERRAAYDRGLPPPLPQLAPPVPPPSPPPPSAPTPAPPRAPSSPELDRARQQAFASRLGGNTARFRGVTPATAFNPGGPTPGKPSPAVRPAGRASSPGMPAVDPKAAVDALRRRYEDSVAHARTRTLSQHLQGAEAAVTKGDFTEAARLYRLAFEQGADPAIGAALAQVEAKAKEQQHASAIARAKEAEQKQDYVTAGASWGRACELVPSAETANRAAMCLRRAGNDSRRAAKYGEEAVKLEPNKATHRVTLALIYADAGLVLRAHGEIERAQALDPQNPLVKEALVRIRAMK